MTTDNKAPREFWIDTYTNRHDILDEEETDGYYAGDALRKHPRQGPPLFQSSLIHVIEKYAYDKLQSRLKKAEHLLKSVSSYVANFSIEMDGHDDRIDEYLAEVKGE